MTTDITFCSNEDCSKKFNCVRYVCMPESGIHSVCKFDDNDCEFYFRINNNM